MPADSAVPLCTGQSTRTAKSTKYMRNTPKSVWTAKLRCSCGAGFIQFKWRVNRDGAVVHGFQCYRCTRRPSISYLQEHGLDLGISCQIKAISEWKLDLMASKVFQNLTFDKVRPQRGIPDSEPLHGKRKRLCAFPERRCWKAASPDRGSVWIST